MLRCLLRGRGPRGDDAKFRSPSDPIHRHGKDVTDAALGLDDARCARVAFQLAPKAQDLHVDAAVENVLVDAGRLQKVLAAERALRRLEKGNEQRVLALGQDHGSAVRIGEPSCPAVELPTGESPATALGLARRRCASGFEASQHRPHTRKQLAQIEGLRQIIVGAELQPDDTIDVVATMTCNDDHRYVGARAHLAQQIADDIQCSAELPL
jgi:hypothetical protein